MCTHVNVCVCRGQRLTPDSLFAQFLTYLFGQVSSGPGAKPFGETGGTQNPREPPVSTSPVLCLQTWTTAREFYTGTWESKLRASCLQSKCFSDHSLFSAIPLFLLGLYLIPVIVFGFRALKNFRIMFLGNEVGVVSGPLVSEWIGPSVIYYPKQGTSVSNEPSL